MFDVDLIIPCYGNSEIIEKGIASLAIQWHKEYLHVTLVNDCSPNTDCDYQDLVDKYKNFMDIRCIRTTQAMSISCLWMRMTSWETGLHFRSL